MTRFFDEGGKMNGIFESNASVIVDIPICEISDFPNHPYKVIDNSEMQELIESIKRQGVLTPALIRKTAEGYEMIAGHRRKFACRRAGLDTLPCIVFDLNDDEAVLAMVGSNRQREKVLPSEKAFAYRMMYESMRRQGQRSDLTMSPVGTKSRSDEELGDLVKESRNQVQRCIRLTYLIPQLLQLVDSDELSIRAGVELSFLSADEQETLLEYMRDENCIPLVSTATKLKEFSKAGQLTEENILSILTGQMNQKITTIKLPKKQLRRFFDGNSTTQTIEDTIVKALELYFGYDSS